MCFWNNRRDSEVVPQIWPFVHNSDVFSHLEVAAAKKELFLSIKQDVPETWSQSDIPFKGYNISSSARIS